MAPSSTMARIAPSQGAEDRSALSGVTIKQYVVNGNWQSGKTLDSLDRQLTAIKNLTFQKIFDIIYIQNKSGYDKSPPVNSPGNHDFD